MYSNSSPNQIIVDAVTHVSGHPLIIQNIGTTNQNGTSALGPAVNGVFSAGSIEFAFIPSTREGSRKGFEIKIPLSEVSATQSDWFQLFATMVASTAYFSDQTIPGNVISGNSGWAPDYLNNLTHPNCNCPNPNSLIGNSPYHTLRPVEIFRPNGGETFNIGYPDTIKWKSTLNNIKLLYSTDSGNNWSIIENSFSAATGRYTWLVPNTPSENALVRIADAVNDTIFDVSDNSFKITPAVDIKDIFMTQIPTEYKLLQNFPNPFNSKTNIYFGIPEEGYVELKVFDLLGKELGILVKEYKPTGYYRVEFDSGNNNSGIYFYQIKAGNFIDIKKMILMK